MNENQLKALNMYLDARKTLINLSDKFASIGLLIDQENDLNGITTVQDDYRFVTIVLDEYIKEVMNLECFSEEEVFFETISEYLYAKETKEIVIKYLNTLLNKNE